jgi:hypothetical protein
VQLKSKHFVNFQQEGRSFSGCFCVKKGPHY